jgi:hypothetical protein
MSRPNGSEKSYPNIHATPRQWIEIMESTDGEGHFLAFVVALHGSRLFLKRKVMDDD